MIGLRIKLERAKRCITQEKLMKISGVSYQTIRNIENNITANPGILTVSRIAKALDIPIDLCLRPLNNYEMEELRVSRHVKEFSDVV